MPLQSGPHWGCRTLIWISQKEDKYKQMDETDKGKETGGEKWAEE